MNLKAIFSRKAKSDAQHVKDNYAPDYTNDYAGLTTVPYLKSPYSGKVFNSQFLEAESRKIARDSNLTADNGDILDGEIDAIINLENRNDISTYQKHTHTIKTEIAGIWNAEKKRIDKRVETIDDEIPKVRNRWAQNAEILYKDTSYAQQVEDVKENLTDPFYERSSKAFWQNQLFIFVFTIGLACVDGAFLYMLMDQIFTQKPIYSWITSIALAVILNMIPLIMGSFINEWRYNLKKNAKYYAIALGVTYMLLFLPLSVVRINYANETVPKSNTTQLINTASTDMQTEKEDESSLKQYTVVGLLVCEPLSTSLIALFLELLSNDRLDKETAKLYESFASLSKEKNNLICEKETLMNSMELELNRELRRLEGELEFNESIRKLAKTVVRNAIAIELKDPEASSFLAAQNVQIANEPIPKPSEILAGYRFIGYEDMKNSVELNKSLA